MKAKQIDLTDDVFYQPSEDDEYAETFPNQHEEPKRINLNAITYYAKLGLKPLRIALLVGTYNTTIWSNVKMRYAYERGAAWHEVYLRTKLLESLARKPENAFQMLERAIGSAEIDQAEGLDPTIEKKADIRRIEVSIVTNDNPEIEQLKADLDKMVEEASQKK